MAFIETRDLKKTYIDEAVEALRGVTLSIEAGGVVAIMGQSGCGKSTLLHIIGALDQPTSGQVFIDGKTINEYGSVYQFRSKMIGFVFQNHYMVSGMTLVENVAAPLVAQGLGRRERIRKAQEMLERVGLEQRSQFLPSRVSGGERQRAAVARALVASPKIILADEPTGNLDSHTGDSICKLLLEHANEKGTTVIIATHNHEIAAMAGKTIMMLDGQVVGNQGQGFLSHSK